MTGRRPVAVHAVTRGGAALAGRIAAALGADLFVAERFAAEVPAARPFPLPLRDALARSFRDHPGHVLVLAVGAAVRVVAPLLDSKWTDPAVVCVDEAGTWAVPLLSGHVGGANELARRVAAAVGATAVVTTASDVRGLFAVDLLGRERGWTFEDPRGRATRAAAALVNGEPLLLVDEAGELEAWDGAPALPPGVERARSLDGVDPGRFEAILLVSDREPADPAVRERAVLYRPRTLAVGVGCDRGAPAGLVERAVASVLARHGLALASVVTLASIDVKRDEEGLLALSEKLGRPLRFYAAAELDRVPGIERPSATVQRHVGTRGVAEPAALLAAGAAALCIPKQVYTEPGAGRSVTVAAARVPPARRTSDG
jgi:cobalt-precorrin 5A hydrolase